LSKTIWENKVFLLFLLLVLVSFISPPVNFGHGDQSLKSSSSSVITFRLLAVQRKFRFNGVDKDMQSAEYLIDALLRHTNWNNASTTYVSYIHLLSSRNLAGHPKYGRFYRGDATKENMRREIRNFLCQPVAGENLSRSVRILYYIGHGGNGFLYLDKKYYYKELKEDLLSGGLGNNNCTLIILDTCHSGSAINDGKCGGTLGKPGWVVLSACKSSESAWGWNGVSESHRAYPGYWGVFTGYNSTQYKNGTTLPVGLIGAMHGGATDCNNDGWLSAGELNYFAARSTIQYQNLEGNPQHPVSYVGVLGGQIPVIPCWYYWAIPPIPMVPWPGNGVPYEIKLIPPPYAEWEQYGHDVTRTGYAIINGPVSNNLLYYEEFSGPIVSSAAVVDGMVFVTTHSGATDAIYALDIKNGVIVWKYPQIGYLPAPVSSSPSVVNGVVFFGTEAPDSRIYAIDAYTGIARWVSNLTGGIFSSPAVADNRVFIGTLDGFFYCLNMTNGEILWEYAFGGAPILSSPAVAYGKVFFGTDNPNCTLYALDEFTGDFLWGFSDGTPIQGSPAVVDELVFIGTLGGTLYALNEISGDILWSYTISAPIHSSPAVDSFKQLVIIGAEYDVVCVEEMTGTPRWMFSTSSEIGFSSPAITSNGLVYIGSHDNNVYCINETTGVEVWNFTTGGTIDSSPAISAEHLFIGSSDGKLYCIGMNWPDIGIKNCWLSKRYVRPSEKTITIYCTVENLGNITETFNLTCYLDPVHLDPLIYERPSKTVLKKTITLNPGESITVNGTVDISDLISISYSWKLWADVDVVMYEAKMDDNQFTNGLLSIICHRGGGAGKRALLR